MEKTWDLIIAIVASGVLSTLISNLFARSQRKKQKEDGVALGTRMLLYMQIKSQGLKYIEAGEITSDELEDLIEAHKIYHNELNGNGFLDNIMKQVGNVKIVERKNKLPKPKGQN